MNIRTNKIFVQIGIEDLTVDDVGVSFPILIEKDFNANFCNYATCKRIQIFNSGEIKIL